MVQPVTTEQWRAAERAYDQAWSDYEAALQQHVESLTADPTPVEAAWEKVMEAREALDALAFPQEPSR